MESIGAFDIEAALAVLGAGTGGAEWTRAESVLRHAGPVAWLALAEEVVIGAEESAQRAGVLLGFTHVTEEIQIRVAGLLDEDPRERCRSVFVLGLGGSVMAPFARVLATALDDPDPRVVAAAVGAFAGIGRATLPVLRQVRRARPGSRAVLAALAEIGWDTLDPRDVQVLTRLIAAKSRIETPQPFHADAEWYALRTTDRDAVLRAFDLSDPVPVTMRAGFERWFTRRTTPPGQWLLDSSAEHRQCGQMFVTPVLDGWTLVLGKPKELYHDDDNDEDDYEHEAQQRRCVDLSRQFGTVYWYVQIGNGGCGDWTGWCAAEQGTLRRYYHHDFDEGAVEVGEPLAAEAGLRDPDGAGLSGLMHNHLSRERMRSLLDTQPDYDDPDLDDGAFAAAQQIWADRVKAALAEAGVEVLPTRSASLIAGRTTVGLDELGPGTQVEGRGVLALTECGRQWGHRGAFPL
ncbi:hypothetical protein [Nocardia sp. XZ_19_385]|uniref:hypothetical protein n=1 Tax=Nocardia sp. XZ_19_385 TaxID=2769488 RepID=UPI00188ECCDF|nr:hypothetical protein [Nocardia sp. XZ_19_385]